jgi:hypothetical protein
MFQLNMNGNIQKITISDAFGNIIWNEENISKGTSHLNIDIKGISKGLYYIRIYAEGESFSGKIIISD